MVKFDGDPQALAWKFPGEDLSTATQVVVNQAQEALLFKGGRAHDVLGPGTHTLSTGNIPLIAKLVNLPFGRKTPFTAEIWYVDKTVRRNLRWGTKSPIPLFDPVYKRPVNVRAYGGWGMRVEEARSFLTQIVGTDIRADTDRIYDYFISEIHQHLVTAVGGHFADISVLHASSHLTELSRKVMESLIDPFARYGIELTNFNIASLTLPPEEMRDLQEKLDAGLDEAARVGRLREATGLGGDRVYGSMRSFDTLEKAAGNESGAAGALMSTGLGAGVGFGLGAVVGQNIDPIRDTAPPKPSATEAGTPAERMRKLKDLLDAGLISEDEFASKRQAIIDSI